MQTRLKLLNDLADQIRTCSACRLCHSRTHAVPGEGPSNARVMLIGEAPGATEDVQGRPFCGRSGRFLDELLAAVGLTRDQIFITSAVKCRPPKNRTPKDDETATCRQLWLDRQIELINPNIVVLLGRTPIRQLFGEKSGLAAIHGQLRPRDGRQYLLTYHPAAAMRFPAPRRAMIEDFVALRSLLGPRSG